MKMKRIISCIAMVVCFGILTVFYVFRDQSDRKLNVVAVNDIVQTLVNQWGNIDVDKLKGYGLDFVVLDENSQSIAQTRRGLNMDLTSAIRNRDTIVDIMDDEKILGKLILYNDNDELWSEHRNSLLQVAVVTILFIGAFCVLYAFFLQKTIFLPFQKLKRFARHVAQGQLDIPLEMDKKNGFGAFTESFDLMREELYKAREGEKAANQSKKELVASLSHDIKTPVASIKAVTELLQAKINEDSVKKQLDIVTSKADQINTLITNMFTATLEELQELKVEITEQPSTLLYELIKDSDYNHQVTISKKAECIIIADKLRLSQIIDNIISNSYKYAGTSIDVSFQIKGSFLEVSFQDYGLGVLKEEELLIFNKFYRAKNAVNKSGAGLGLYISRYLIEKMSGKIECETVTGGFVVKLRLKIA